MNRQQNLQRLQTEQFDLCIIGGGASGAGCALDAALRGLKVALIERDDFAAETSSKSTKLIHGGVRYLEQAFKNLDFSQLRQVRHGLEERHILLRNAPHLAHPLALITPVFTWLEGLYFSIGLKMYGWFASRKDTLPPSRWLSKKETLERIPTLSLRLNSAVLYYDGQINDARFCLALVQSANEAGAVVLNHADLLEFTHNNQGQISSARVHDLYQDQQFEIQSKVFLNCTGPHADTIRRLANDKLAPRIRPSKGVHVVLPGEVLSSSDALLIPKTPDGRVVFAIPFEGKTLLGTTDHPYAHPEKEPMLESDELNFLCETLQPYLAQKIDKERVMSGFGGLRPLVTPAASGAGGGRQTKTMLRDHEVEYDPISGLLSLMGGKWTTYRLMAADAVDAVCRQLAVQISCTTDTHFLIGAAGFTKDSWQELHSKFGFDTDVCQHLSQHYGDRAEQIASLALDRPDLAERLHPDYPFLCAEIVYAARREMACTIRDMLARRLRLEILDWQAVKSVTEATSSLMAAELGWSVERQQHEQTSYFNLIESFQNRLKISPDTGHNRV
jgi:glycerol-3-phosphate dehydrogenase